MSHCCVYGCSNSYKKAARERKDVHFYSFPKYSWMKERRKIWIQFAKRKNHEGKPWVPSKRSKICSEHFVGGTRSEDPRNPSYNPTIFNVKKHVELSSSSKVDRFKRTVKRAVQQKTSAKEIRVDQNPITDQDNLLCSDQPIDSQQPHRNPTSDLCYTVHTQTSPCHTSNVEQQTDSPEFHDKRCGPDNQTAYFGGYIALNAKQTLKEFAGVSNNVFALLASLFPNPHCTVRELKLEDKLLLTLFKLKSGLTFAAIGVIFGIAERSAARIFDNTINHLAKVTKHWIFLPTQDATRATLPLAFRGKYDNCRMIATKSFLPLANRLSLSKNNLVSIRRNPQ